MSYLDISRVATALASIFITIGLYLQAGKIWRTHSAKDFTATIIIALLVNEVVWLNYGFAIFEWPIVLISCLNLPAAIWAGIGFYKYRGGPDATDANRKAG